MIHQQLNSDIMSQEPRLETAGQTVAAGDVIMERDPWVWAFHWDGYQEYCAGCFYAVSLRTSQSLLCPGCQVHRYCSVKCQDTDWKTEHKHECTLMKRLKDYRLQLERQREQHSASQPQGDKTFLFSMFTVMNLKIQNKIQKSVSDRVPGLDGTRSAKEILQLFDRELSAKEAPKSTELMQSEVFKGLISAMYPKAADRPAANDSIDIQLRILQHAYPLRDYLSGDRTPQPIGAGLFVGVKKSDTTPPCLDYNALPTFQGKTLRLVAMDDIVGFRELNDTRWCNPMALDYILPLKQRREYFLRIHGSPCHCRKCTPGYEAEINPLKCVTKDCQERIPSDERALLPCAQCGAVNDSRLRALRSFMEKYEDVFQMCLTAEFTSDNRLNEVLQFRKLGVLQEMDAGELLHPEAHLRFICAWAVTDVYDKQKQFAENWALYQDCMRCTRIIFPKYHLTRAHFLAFAGGFAITYADSVTKDPRRKPGRNARIVEIIGVGIEYLTEASDIYTKLFGTVCDFVFDMQMRIREAQDILRVARRG
ncbi:uncharacterized protein LOC129598879 [Paramacrobiotus metropolitanus]|uniref:uncharacterized protein LOC129598879 n=1 Tax=Paramacrobiotus metropolitanus TaxID=2943436 RepID=UPI00244643EA|nr:uncharacterized protein LOC129598879 [Paramacrobiotus metropolitanus]